MTLDRRRARVDLVTALVPLVVISGWAGWTLLTAGATNSDSDDVPEIWGWLLGLGVGPQIVQAILGQLLFRRQAWPRLLRGAVMVVVWLSTFVVGWWVATGEVSGTPLYLGGLVIVPLLVLTRLVVAAAVSIRAEESAQRPTDA